MESNDNAMMLGMIPLPLFFSGVKYSVNPFSLASLLIFALILGYCTYDIKGAIRCGFAFIVPVVVCTCLAILGILDFYETNIHINNLIFVFNWSIAIVCIIVGIVCFIDWVRSKIMDENFNAILKIPSLWNALANTSEKVQEKEKGKPKRMGCVPISILFGIIAAMNNSTWPEPSDIYFSVMQYIYVGNVNMAIGIFLVFCVIITLPMQILWLIVIILYKRVKGIEITENIASLTRVLSSAIFLAVGISLVRIMLV